MKKIKHFAADDFQSHAGQPSNEAYGATLDNVVFATVDCVVVNPNGQMLLGKRQQEPWPDWFIIGGRMKPGETVEQTAQRTVEREIGLVGIDPARFVLLEVASNVWAKRQQPPQENGSHCLSVIMVLIVTAEEAAAVKQNEEYSELKWEQVEKVVVGKYHPIVRTYAKDFLLSLQGTR